MGLQCKALNAYETKEDEQELYMSEILESLTQAQV